MSDSVKEYKLQSGKILEIHHDENPESPREWDNLGIVACSHKRYSLSDKSAPDVSPKQGFDNWDEVERFLVKEHNAAVILPIYMYDHSGISISTEPFTCGWDSGKVGFIYATVEKIKQEYGVKRITKKTKEQVTGVLEGEIETYNQYVQGDVYGFRIMKVDIASGERDQEDSCWGFYGLDFKDNGILDHIADDDAILEEL